MQYDQASLLYWNLIKMHYL